METEEERRARLENETVTKRLSLAMEMDEERKARLEKMVATTQLRLTLETEEERRAKKDIIWIGFGFNLNSDWSFQELKKIQGMSSLTLQWEPYFSNIVYHCHQKRNVTLIALQQGTGTAVDLI